MLEPRSNFRARGGGRVPGLPGLLAHEPRRKDILAPAKQRAEQLHLLGGRPRRRYVDGKRQPNAALRLGAERSQLGPNPSEPTSRGGLVRFELRAASLFLRDRGEQFLAAERGHGRQLGLCELQAAWSRR